MLTADSEGSKLTPRGINRPEGRMQISDWQKDFKANRGNHETNKSNILDWGP